MKNNLFVKIILIFIVATVISVIAIKNLINVKYRESVVDELKKIHIIEVHLKENNKEQELEILHNGMVLGNISEKISGLGYKNKIIFFVFTLILLFIFLNSSIFPLLSYII